MNIDQIYMSKAIENAKKAFELDEVPVGAIIIKNNKIIASTYNLKEHNKDATSHAEILAIKQACHVLNSPYLNDCEMYVTLEPCMMCTGAIINSRLKKIVFGAYDQRFISLETIMMQINQKSINYMPIFYGGVLEDECSTIIKEYFKKKRK